MNQINHHQLAPYVQHLRAGHQRAGAILCQIDELWQLVLKKWDQGKSGLLAALESLRCELSQHFEQEDCGGCLEQAISQQPHLSGEMHRLERDRARILDELQNVAGQLRSLKDSAELEQTKSQYDTFAARLRNHALAENRVLEECSGIPVE